MRVALIHDWLTGMRGGEKCLEALCGFFPDADLYTLVHVPGSVSPLIEDRTIHTSFIQKLPGAAAKYRRYLPLFPRAIERFDFSGYDMLASCSHCVAKGVRTPEGAPHVCYCFTPMRYVWDMYDQYFGPETPTGRNPIKRRLIARMAARLRKWDARTSDRVTHYVAISHYIADRIRRHYGRDSAFIYPPVDCARFPEPTVPWTDGGYYLALGAMAPYKRVDLAVRAADELDHPLWVAGDGQDADRLRAMAGPNVRFLGRVSDDEVTDLYANCRALIFTAEEDFGIVPLEASASGRPVVAFGRGGALETVVAPRARSAEGKAPTGVFFDARDPASVAEAVRRLEADAAAFDPMQMRAHALTFDLQVFKRKMRDYIFNDVLQERPS